MSVKRNVTVPLGSSCTAEMLGGFGGKPLVVGVRWSFADKDAGSLNSSAIRATEDAAQRASSVRRRLNLVFAKSSYPRPYSFQRRVTSSLISVLISISSGHWPA